MSWRPEPRAASGAANVSVRALATAVVVVSALLAGCADRTGPAGDLRAALDDLDEPDRFTLTYLSHGSQVLDCFAPNRSFTLEVDQSTRRVDARVADDGTVLAQRDGEVVMLHRSLFAADAVASSWVEVDLRTIDAASEEVLRRVLGADLSGYLLAPDLPSSGEAIAAASAEIAEEVQQLSEDANGVTFRVTLDAERFAAESGGPDVGDPSMSDAPPPVIELTIDDVRVSQVTVRPPGREDGNAAGWSIRFGSLDPGTAPPRTGSVAALGQLDLAQLFPRSSGTCALGSPQ
ncbi:hypothetical protein [Actinomarinicola tropica]|uniref:LppX_LprAFG lipoprotein n=1 Tax=Actinomarinicola tropica TaxID=2789776 RepID=A0A5Q2RSR1_9ACTN|nr:hypothetical protein [Actinomarinicola tropica]QGG96245.1 hypothetical protein GH723_14675 [Actinomarinicola tropica]